MKTSEEIKQEVKEKYSEIALQSKQTNETSCCGSGCCSEDSRCFLNLCLSSICINLGPQHT